MSTTETAIRDRIVQIKTMRLGDVRLNVRNWRGHPEEQRDALRGVLREVGWCGIPLAYRSERNGGALTWVDGNLRGEDNPELRAKVAITDLTDEEADLVLLTFDPIGAMAVADKEKLEALMRETAVQDEAVRKMLEGLAEVSGLELTQQPLGEVGEDPGSQVDRGEELAKKWKTEAGQLWEIPSLTVSGNVHRLLCGDSTSADDVTRLMDGRRAALFATDPPYAVSYDGTNHPHAWGERDNNKDWSESYHDWDKIGDPEQFYDDFTRLARELAITEDAAWYCWHASRCQAMVERVWEKNGAFMHQQIIWAKDRPILTRSWYLWQHEPCFFGWVKGKKPPRASDDYPTTVWLLPTTRPGGENLHPTEKPTEVFAIPIRQHTTRDDVCYEPFGGSGSQLVAAEEEGRTCYTMELAPQYVAAILERLSLMGLEPRLC